MGQSVVAPAHISRWIRCTAALAALGLACQTADRTPVGAPARRIVSLSPGFTEILFAIGAGDRVVGRTRWDEDPAAARAVPSVGDGLDPNVEAVLARRPDLVVLYESPMNATAIARLADAGIATVSLPFDRLDDVPRVTRRLGRLTGDSARADSVASAFEADLAAASSPVSGAAPAPSGPTVLVLAWPDPPIVIGGGSFLSELVERAGARNVFRALQRPSATVSIETIVARDPDLVLVTGGPTEGRFVTRPEWQAVRAIRERRLVVVEGAAFGHPSLQAPEAIRELRGALGRAVR